MDIYQFTQRKALISRGAAKEVAHALKGSSAWNPMEVELDFTGIEAVTPSFIDELLSQLLSSGPDAPAVLRFKNPPSRMSEKFRAIARGRELSIKENERGDWVIETATEGVK